jgi:hypothetical protein
MNLVLNVGCWVLGVGIWLVWSLSAKCEKIRAENERAKVKSRGNVA